MKAIADDDKDSGIKLHRNNCDTLYRWSMWRMYLNEEMSRVITARRDHSGKSHTTSALTAPYIRHPDAKKYGREMKKLFQANLTESHPRHSVDILPDNVYLVYGLPRVSVRKHAPVEVQQLHQSVLELEMLHKQREKKLGDSINADKHISNLFDFVDVDVTESESENQLSGTRLASGSSDKHPDKTIQRATGSTIEIQSPTKYSTDEHVGDNLNLSLNGSTNNATKVNIHHANTGKNVPLVSKSRMFWEMLADKKSEIIHTGKEKPEKTDNNEHSVISSEILQKQQKLLKKTFPKRTSKDLWNTIRDRKTEILQLRDLTSASGQNRSREREYPHCTKKHESKTSQLWSFIFSKKKELVQMKRGHKGPNEATTKAHTEQSSKKNIHAGANDASTSISPRNFEGSFQNELAEKIRKRRIHLQPVTASSSSSNE